MYTHVIDIYIHFLGKSTNTKFCDILSPRFDDTAGVGRCTPTRGACCASRALHPGVSARTTSSFRPVAALGSNLSSKTRGSSNTCGTCSA